MQHIKKFFLLLSFMSGIQASEYSDLFDLPPLIDDNFLPGNDNLVNEEEENLSEEGVSIPNVSQPSTIKGKRAKVICKGCNKSVIIHLLKQHFLNRHPDIVPSLKTLITNPGKGCFHKEQGCGSCTQVFACNKDVYMHFNNEHMPPAASSELSEINDNDAESEKDNTVITCNGCGASYHNSNKLVDHLILHHKDIVPSRDAMVISVAGKSGQKISYYCRVCHKRCALKSAGYIHFNAKHMTLSPSLLPVAPMKNIIFHNEKILPVSISCAPSKKNQRITCNLCSMSTLSPAYLAQHLVAKHSDIVPSMDAIIATNNDRNGKQHHYCAACKIPFRTMTEVFVHFNALHTKSLESVTTVVSAASVQSLVDAPEKSSDGAESFSEVSEEEESMVSPDHLRAMKRPREVAVEQEPIETFEWLDESPTQFKRRLAYKKTGVNRGIIKGILAVCRICSYRCSENDYYNHMHEHLQNAEMLAWQAYAHRLILLQRPLLVQKRIIDGDNAHEILQTFLKCMGCEQKFEEKDLERYSEHIIPHEIILQENMKKRVMQYKALLENPFRQVVIEEPISVSSIAPPAVRNEMPFATYCE